jgi:hypothetical protein
MYVFFLITKSAFSITPIQPLLIILFLEAIALCEINHNQIFNHPLGCARVYYAGVVPGSEFEFRPEKLNFVRISPISVGTGK